MSKHIGNIGDKISAQVKLVHEFEYTDYSFSYYGTTHNTYIMEDGEGNLYVWKTTSCMGTWDKETGEWDGIHRGDTLIITGKVKEHSEYKGVKQTVLTRCKSSLVGHGKDPIQEKSEKQTQSLEAGDFIWEMPYRQYKEHYSDCETVVDSYDSENATIKVIIRAGRLKASGVRGKHFAGYCFETPYGYKKTYRAVSEENARKQMLKEYPDSENWELVDIFMYINKSWF